MQDDISAKISRFELVFRAVVTTLIVVGTLMRINQVFICNPLDQLQADAMANYKWALDPKGSDLEGILHPLGFQIFLSWVLRITGDNHLLVSLVMSMLTVVTPWLFYRWLRELTRDKSISLLGYALFTFAPTFFRIFSYFMDAVLQLPLVCAALWLTWRATRKLTWNSCLLAAVVAGTAVVTKIFTIPIVVLPWLYVFHKLRQAGSLRLAARTVAASVAIIGCFWFLLPLKIWAHTGAFVLCPDSYERRYFESGCRGVLVNSYYNRPSNNTTWQESAEWIDSSVCNPPFTPFSSWVSDRQGIVKVDVDYRHGFEDIKRVQVPLMERLRYTLENIIYFFWSMHWPEDFADDQAGYPRAFIPMSRFLWFPLTLFLFAWILLKRRREFMGWYFIVVTLAFLLQQSGIMEGRYTKPWQALALGTLIYLFATSKLYRWIRQKYFDAKSAAT